MTGLVDEPAKPLIFAGSGALVQGAGGDFPQAGRRRPLRHSPKVVDPAVDVAVCLKDFQEGLALAKDLLKVRTAHRQKK